MPFFRPKSLASFILFVAWPLVACGGSEPTAKSADDAPVVEGGEEDHLHGVRASSEIGGMNEDERALFGIDKLNVARSQIPAVTHVDYSARIQTVHADTNPRYHALLEAFEQRTGCPVLVNTSFNVRGEPIVCTPEDAFRCFMGTEIELLVAGNCVLDKTRQDPALKKDYKEAFELD